MLACAAASSPVSGSPDRKHCDRHQNAQDDDDDQELDEGESLFLPVKRLRMISAMCTGSLRMP